MTEQTEAAVFYDSYLPDALFRALAYAGDDGFVASMPQLLHARVNADYDNEIWNTWFTSNSEESIVTTTQGNHVVVIVHGGGIFSNPERFRKLYHADVSRYCEVGFTGLFAAKITEREATGVLEGKLSGGVEIPLYTFSEFVQGIANPTRRYGVVLDFSLAKESLCGYVKFEQLMDDPLMIARAGGVESLHAYLKKAQSRNATNYIGHWHPFNDVEPTQAQTRVPVLAGNKGGIGSEDDDGHLYGYDTECGIGGDAAIHNSSMINIARYIAIAPCKPTSSLRYLPF